MFWPHAYFAFLVFVVIFGIWAVWYNVDWFYALVRKQAVALPSSKALRDAVIAEINSNHKNMKSVVDIGSCYGGLARRIARECPGKSVIAVENLPRPAIVSKICDLFASADSKTKWADAFSFIEKSRGFDIGVAYMSVRAARRLCDCRNKFKVLIVLDFPLPDIEPVKKTKLHKDLLGQHFLYVYEN